MIDNFPTFPKNINHYIAPYKLERYREKWEELEIRKTGIREEMCLLEKTILEEAKEEKTQIEFEFERLKRKSMKELQKI